MVEYKQRLMIEIISGILNGMIFNTDTPCLFVYSLHGHAKVKARPATATGAK